VSSTISLLATVLGLSLAAGPDAQSPVTIGADGCAGLDAAEVQRLVQLELAAVTQEIREGPPLHVVLTCREGVLEIAVDDPVTTKHLSRKVPAPAEQPGQERVVALAVAQLFAASWLELLLVEEEPEDDAAPPGPAPSPGTSSEAVAAARRVAETSTSRSPSRIELLAGAGVRGRSLEAATFPALHLDLELRGWLTPSLGLLGRVGFDYGQANRDQGQVRGYDVMGGAGLAWRWRPREAIGLGGSGVLSGGWARVEGIPSSPGVDSAANQGATGEVTVGVGPRVFYGRFRMDIDAEIGGMLRAPEGLVTRQQPVTMGGFYVGATLRLGADLSPGPPT
jgi:hypothetical protein